MIDRKALPDSRLRWRRGTIWHRRLGNMSPIFCAHCGTPQGAVTEWWALRVTVLCDDCADRYGRLPLPEIPESLVRGGI